MSREAEARSGVLGPEAWREAHEQGSRVGGPQAWPMTPEQLAFERGPDCVPGSIHAKLAERIRAVADTGRDRFSPREVSEASVLMTGLDRLVDLGLLRVHTYPSGAWQYVLTPFARSWFMAITTRPKDTACPSLPSTPRPADSIPASARS